MILGGVFGTCFRDVFLGGVFGRGFWCPVTQNGGFLGVKLRILEKTSRRTRGSVFGRCLWEVLVFLVPPHSYRQMPGVRYWVVVGAKA